MRIPCPLCGPRDRREFTYLGATAYLARPMVGGGADGGGDGGGDAVDAHLHLRANPAGRTRELWQHDCCGAWLVVDRCTVTHRVFGATLLTETQDAG